MMLLARQLRGPALPYATSRPPTPAVPAADLQHPVTLSVFRGPGLATRGP
jgi:hypothetical protein